MQELKPIHVNAEIVDGVEVAPAFDYYDREPVDERIAELENNLSEIQSQKMQLEDDVALLRRNNEELKEERKWRKFSEERPKDKQWIFVFVENPSKYGTYIELRRWDITCKFDVEDQELYTKWMPLPKAPEE